jgi:uncharacterized protein YceH (UPF0502 family)
MEATATDVETTPTITNYTSRPGALIWSFRKSRDRWKSKYQELKASAKRDKNRAADLTKSRAQWRLKAEEATARLAALETEVAELRAKDAAGAEKKETQAQPR